MRSEKIPTSAHLESDVFARVSASELNLFRLSARVLFAGESGSGNTILVSRILRKYQTEF